MKMTLRHLRDVTREMAERNRGDGKDHLRWINIQDI